MSTKILAVWYPRNYLIKTISKFIEVDSESNIKVMFGEWLFDKQADYLLVNYNNKMFMIEPADRDARTYNRRNCEYHPLQSEVGIV